MVNTISHAAVHHYKTDFLIKIFCMGKIYANQDTPGNITIYIKFSYNRPKFPFTFSITSEIKLGEALALVKKGMVTL